MGEACGTFFMTVHSGTTFWHLYWWRHTGWIL